MTQRALAALRSIVDVRPGERLMALLMFLYLFLLIGAFAVVKPVRSSLFLDQFGARNLPYIYIATAVLAGGTAWIHSRLIGRFGIVKAQVLIQGFFIANLLIFWLAFRSESPWLTAAFFLWVNIFTVTANTLFWMLANSFYNAREAKRIYGLINAGGTLGGVASGFAVSAIVTRLGTENMLLVCSGVLATGLGLTAAVGRLGRDRLRGGEADYLDRTPEAAAPASRPARSARAIFSSAYPKYIAAALGLSLIISTLIDYQFNVVVEQTYPSKDAKTAFFSSFTAAVNALSFVLQFFLTSQLLRGLGIGLAVLLLPLTLLGGTMWMALSSAFGAAIFLKVADGSVRYSIEQSTRDLLYLPIPNRVMGQLKTFVDVFVQRLAKAIGSLAILILTVWWAFGSRTLNLMSVALAVIWVGCAILLGRAYREQLKNFLTRENLLDEPRRPVLVLDKTTTKELLAAAESGEEERALYALELLEGSRDPDLVAMLQRVVHQGSPRVRASALRLLADLDDASAVAVAEGLLDHDEVEVQEAAIYYVCATSPAGRMEKMKAFLGADDPRLRVPALACVANSGGADGVRMAQPIVDDMLAKPGDQGSTARRLLARTLGRIRPPSPLHDHLGALLHDPSSDVVREALASVRIVRRRDFVPLIIDKLADARVLSDALESLTTYGETVLGTLRDYINDDRVAVEVRRLLPAVFVEVGTERAARDLVACLRQPDRLLCYGIIKALNKLRDRLPPFEVDRGPVDELLRQEVREGYRLLQKLYRGTSEAALVPTDSDPIADVERLNQEYRAAAERIFRLLGLILDQRDVYSAYRGLNSPRPDLKANAIELLETFLPGDLKRTLLPLVDDDLPIVDRLRMADAVLTHGTMAPAGSEGR